MTTLCTLFDHNYLDKGLALYESLENVCEDFELYVLCMSHRCYEILVDQKLTHIIPISLEEFESDELREVKTKRSVGQYCFTCTSNLIKFVLDRYNPTDCTYIDADLFFYEDPKILIDEMYLSGKSVLITSHRYVSTEEKKKSRDYGRYCIEFNSFKNDTKGRQLLEVWRNQCLLRCDTVKGVCWGDQRYLNEWPELYDCVHVVENIGAGVAPWNIRDYKLVKMQDNHYNLLYRGKQRCNLVFFHFEGLKYISKHKVRMGALSHLFTDVALVTALYKSYLKCIDKTKDMLSAHYGLEVLIKAHLEYQNGVRSPFWKRFTLKELGDYLWQVVLRIYYGNKDYLTF